MTQVGRTLNASIPMSMLKTMSAYELANLVSQYQWKIDLDGSLIPTNMISLVFLKSGGGKDSSRFAIEKALQHGYDLIEELRENKAIEKAKYIAEQKGDSEDEYEKHLKKLFPLKNSLSTVEGLTTRLNAFQNDGIGMPSIYSGEFGSELQTNRDIIDNIRLISELYDLGNKQSKAIKDKEGQDSEVTGMGMNALFVGSPSNLILDEVILKKLKTEFVTKLARRSYFVYPDDSEYVNEVFNDFEALLEAKKRSKELGRNSVSTLDDVSIRIHELSSDANVLSISTEAYKMYMAYKVYCESYKDDKFHYESVMLHKVHASWRALKLSGVFAVARGSKIVELVDLHQSVSFTEEMLRYIEKFEDEANMLPYEKLVNYLDTTESEITYNELAKLEWIKHSQKPENQVNQLVELGNSKLGQKGKLHHEDSKVWLEKFIQVDEVGHGASYVRVTGTKEERATKVRDGYTFKRRPFEKLGNLLKNDVAYCAFEFKDGVRSNENIISGATFIVLDIDDSDMDVSEVHNTYQDFKHHIARTSNPDNPYKFRMIMELDVEVKLDHRLWKNFMSKVGEFLGMKIDLLAQSQIYYGFEGREVLSQLEGESIPASELMKDIDTEVKKVEKLPQRERNKLVDDKFNVFNYAYEMEGNFRATALFRVFKQASESGLNKEQVVCILDDIIEYHGNDRDAVYKRTGLMNQIERHYEDK